MSPQAVSWSTARSLVYRIAIALTALSLLVAPFRSSAGLRAAALLIAAGLLAAYWWRSKTPTIRIPAGLFLRTTVALWVVVVFLYSSLSADPLTSLASWRGDVLTPLLAGIVCYSLAQTRQAVGVWLVVLLAGLLALTGMVVVEPFQPAIGTHEPRYLSVGWLSTWVVMLGSLLPLAWLIQWRHAGWGRLCAVVAIASILICAWFSANRIVWLCFGVMLFIYATLNFRSMGGKFATRLALVAAGLVTALAMFFAASGMRAAQFPDANVDSVSILQKDDRQVIWTTALDAIQQRPLTGYGYALEASREALANRFTDPGFQKLFRQAHNLVLNYALQMGIPGGLVVILLFAGLAHAFWTRRNVSQLSRGVATCGLMLVAAFFLRNMTDDFFHRHAALLLGALVGMLLAICDWRSERGAD